jgi:hypothetical protein
LHPINLGAAVRSSSARFYFVSGYGVSNINMATNGQALEEKQIGPTTDHAPDSPVEEKADAIHGETAHEAAERGKAATDK